MQGYACRLLLETTLSATVAGGLFACAGPADSPGRQASDESPYGVLGRPDDNDFTVTNASHPVLSGISEAGLEGWGSSSHAEFTAVPSDFEVIVVENDDGDAIVVVRDASHDVPTLSEWSFVILTLLLAAAGFVATKAR